MTQNIFSYTITECEPVPGAANGTADLIEIDTSIQGDLHLHLRDKEETFERVPLLMVSGSLVDQVSKVLMFDPPGHRRTVVIPDYEPVLGLKLSGDDLVEVSVIIGPEVLAQAECGLMQHVQAVGQFHTAMVQQLMTANPTLLNPWALPSVDPAMSVLLERRGHRPRFQVLD